MTPFAALLAAPLVFGFPLWPLRFHQAEDAYILHSFSRSLAETGSISFYAGGPHAEGATDFLWMLMLSLGYKLGIPPVYCSEILSMFAVLLLGVFLIRIAGKAVRPLRVLAVIAPLMLFPQMIAAYEGFSVTLFAASLAALVFYLQKDRPQAAAVAALVLCLLRPDGVVFAVPLLVVGILFGNRSLWLRWVGTLFVLPGLLYFLWRWHYFGEFLPLPFLVKSDTQRRFGLYVVSSVHDLRPFLAFAIVLLAVALGRRILERKQLAFAAALLVIPTLFYFAMRLDQNIATRFFFYVPVGAALLIALMWDRLAVRRAYVLVAGVVLWALFIAPLEIRYLKQMDTDRSFGRRWVGLSTDLSKVAPHGTLLTSETGVIPYYSHWQTYDPWGLSTAEFAHALIQPDQVVALHPDLVFMHVDNPVSNIPCQFASTPTRVRSWQGMAGNVALGTLKSGDYTYWQLPYEDPATTAQPRPGEVPDVVCAYIRQDFVGRGQVEEVLRRYAGQPTKPSEKLN